MPRLKIKDDRDYIASATVDRLPLCSTPLLNDAPVQPTLGEIEKEKTSLPGEKDPPEEKSSPSSEAAVVTSSEVTLKRTKKKKNEEEATVEPTTTSTEEIEPTKPATVAKQKKRSTKKKKNDEIVDAPRRSGRSRKEPVRYTA